MNAVYPVPSNKRRSLLAFGPLWLCIWTVSLSDPAIAQMSAAESATSLSRFQKTALYVQSAAPPLRSEFAAIALTHLIEGYHEEVRLALDEERSTRTNTSLREWSAAANQYASQIPLLLEDIELGLPVWLAITNVKPLLITVADRVVILSHPRLKQQGFLEQAILMDFCASRRCEKFAPASAETGATFTPNVYVRPDWTFTINGPVCSYQGITVNFKSAKNLAKSRAICSQFLQEVIVLANEISWQRGLAVPIHWSELDIQSMAPRPEHTVRLNELGDTAVAVIPLLYGNPRLLGHTLPWIRQWLANPQEANIELNADQYGWIEP